MFSGRSAVARSGVASLVAKPTPSLTQCHNHASLGVRVASAQHGQVHSPHLSKSSFASAPITPPPQHRVRFTIGAHCLRSFAIVRRIRSAPPKTGGYRSPFAPHSLRCAQRSARMLGLFINGLACLTLPLRPFGIPTNPHTLFGRSKAKGRVGGLGFGLSSAPRSSVRGLRQTFNALLRCGLPHFVLPHPAPRTLNFY